MEEKNPILCHRLADENKSITNDIKTGFADGKRYICKAGFFLSEMLNKNTELCKKHC